MPEPMKNFAVRCKQFFGYLPGQQMSGFANELRQLTPKDKVEMCSLFNEMGLPTTLELTHKKTDVTT